MIKEHLIALLKKQITTKDLKIKVLRSIYLKEQKKYNFYVKKYYFLDNRKNSKLTILVLAGKYNYLWDIVFRRLYEYGRDYNIIIVNPGGLNREKCLKIVKDYEWSYFESYPTNIEAAENFVIKNLVENNLIIKMDDDIFVTKYTFKNLLNAYKKLKEKEYDIGFLAPVLNINTVSYYYFLETLGLLKEYERLFEKPIIFRNWTKQKIWYDPNTAVWIWEHSLPLNQIAEVFSVKNKDKITPISVRFSISLILFEKEFFNKTFGFFARGPKIKGKFVIEKSKKQDVKQEPKIPMFPDFDEPCINFFSDVMMYGRFLVLDSFAGHFSYFTQEREMKKWFEKNKEKLLEDL